MKYLFFIFSFVLFVSCDKNDNKSVRAQETLGRYIYRDDNYIYHIDSNCPKLLFGKDDDGHAIYAKRPIDTADFLISDMQYFRVCTRCVNDNIVLHLCEISERHRSIDRARKWLYDQLIQANYDMPDYETYCNGLKNPEIRQRLYTIAQEENWDVEKSEKEFSSNLGF